MIKEIAVGIIFVIALSILATICVIEYAGNLNNKDEYSGFTVTSLLNHSNDTYNAIKKFETVTNNTGVTLPVVFKNRTPYWYTLKPEESANIFISINPSQRLFFSYSNEPIYLNQRLVAIRTRHEDVEIITALLNSVVSLLIVELNGVSRNLGALDLNADFFKTKMKILNPNLLTNEQKEEILNKFRVLSTREIQKYDTEYRQDDRIAFDEEILNAFGFDIGILPQLYELLTETIRNRVEMKNR